MATFYSLAKPMTKMKLAMAGLFLVMLAGRAAAEAPKKIYVERAEKAFHVAQDQFLASTNNSTNAWRFARATFDLCELTTNQTERARIARLGIEACRQLVAREPKSAPGHYYLAMNYGELADAESPSIAAYKLVKDVEREFKTAGELDEHFDFAGPVRNLGELYFQAPGWPLSVGNKHKARERLEHAAAIAPEYPENFLNLAEAQMKWQQADDAAKTLKKLDQLWPAALTNFAGVTWEPSWDDWRSRRLAAKTESARTAQEKNSH
jgi:tetratricopeptide (TPR) repeat protein